jgi:hypothetical protein
VNAERYRVVKVADVVYVVVIPRLNPHSDGTPACRWDCPGPYDAVSRGPGKEV